jgi:hypothetical protein
MQIVDVKINATEAIIMKFLPQISAALNTSASLKNESALQDGGRIGFQSSIKCEV